MLMEGLIDGCLEGWMLLIDEGCDESEGVLLQNELSIRDIMQNESTTIVVTAHHLSLTIMRGAIHYHRLRSYPYPALASAYRVQS